ncbi:MAG TPA: gluconeogenesis factor YvcK family protein [Candidatus Nanopelagicaceae bacterium]|nr:gluconeogenesis factor YvcK family protein [Candidatus Nanopelagicaceae bacterium]
MRTPRFTSGVTRWLVPGLHVKRWLGVTIVAVVAISLGISYALRDFYLHARLPAFTYGLTLQFWPRWVRAVLFAALGLLLLGVGLYKLTKSLLSPFPGGDKALVERLYDFRRRRKGPRIVAVGGGTGLSTLLRGIKSYSGNVTALVTVADDGGSSGRLRQEYQVLPPGDFRQCLTALADVEPLMTELFQYRFEEGSLRGHSFGNLFIMAMTAITGDFEHALRESGRVLAVRGQIVPSTLESVTLCAVSGDEVLVGESQVPTGKGPIGEVFLVPEHPRLNPEAELAIMNAEMIVIGPGSLYTSLLPNLLVDGMVDSLRRSPAIKVYVCNVATQPGETSGYSIHDHFETLERYVGPGLFDYVVANSNLSLPLSSAAQEAGIRRAVFDRKRIMAQGSRPKYILADLASTRITTHHDSDKLAQVLMKRVWSRS